MRNVLQFIANALDLVFELLFSLGFLFVKRALVKEVCLDTFLLGGEPVA